MSPDFRFIVLKINFKRVFIILLTQKAVPQDDNEVVEVQTYVVERSARRKSAWEVPRGLGPLNPIVF
jgi:hypothetical protein